MYEPIVKQVFSLNGRRAWLYLADMTIGTLYIVQHEVMDEMNIVDDYIGWHVEKAEAAFHKITTRMLRGRE